eukprot:RCo033759
MFWVPVCGCKVVCGLSQVRLAVTASPFSLHLSWKFLYLPKERRWSGDADASKSSEKEKRPILSEGVLDILRKGVDGMQRVEFRAMALPPYGQVPRRRLRCGFGVWFRFMLRLWGPCFAFLPGAWFLLLFYPFCFALH